MKITIEEVDHPSFGQIRFSTTQGSQKFYGSDLRYNHYISFEIKQSTLVREIGSERYSTAGNRGVVRGRMTANQFAEMIASMNHEGVPCTIESISGERVEQLPEVESSHTANKREFKAAVETIVTDLDDKIKKISDMLKKPKLTKDDKEVISWALGSVKQELSSNIPFLVEEIEGQVDKKAVEAKVEVENSLNYKINSLGLIAYNEEQKQLNNE